MGDRVSSIIWSYCHVILLSRDEVSCSNISPKKVAMKLKKGLLSLVRFNFLQFGNESIHFAGGFEDLT